MACGEPTADVELSIEQLDVVLCQCHHGFGFGLDATAQMPVANLGDADARLTLDRVRLIARDVQTIVEVDDPFAVADMSFGPDHNDLSFRILRPAPDGATREERDATMGGEFGWGSFTRTIGLRAGTVETLTVQLYFDPLPSTSIVQDGAARYNVELEFSTDDQQFVQTREVSVQFQRAPL